MIPLGLPVVFGVGGWLHRIRIHSASKRSDQDRMFDRDCFLPKTDVLVSDLAATTRACPAVALLSEGGSCRMVLLSLFLLIFNRFYKCVTFGDRTVEIPHKFIDVRFDGCLLSGKRADRSCVKIVLQK